jgi:hypothetical protein
VAFLETIDYDGCVEILPGSHGSVITQPLFDRIEKEMADRCALPYGVND